MQFTWNGKTYRDRNEQIDNLIMNVENLYNIDFTLNSLGIKARGTYRDSRYDLNTIAVNIDQGNVPSDIGIANPERGDAVEFEGGNSLRLWVYTEIDDQAGVEVLQWIGPININGPQGIPGRDGVDGPQGPQGPPVTISIDRTDTTAPGENAQATAYNDSQGNVHLTFAIPRGQVGPAGAQGPPGTNGTDGQDGVIGRRFPVIYSLSELPAFADALVGDQYIYYDGTIYSQYYKATNGTDWDIISPYGGTRGEKGDTGATGEQGPQGSPGADGPAGPGVPAGGINGMVLTKNSIAPYDTSWQYPPRLIEVNIQGTYSTDFGGIHATPFNRPFSLRFVCKESDWEDYNQFQRTANLNQWLFANGFEYSSEWGNTLEYNDVIPIYIGTDHFADILVRGLYGIDNLGFDGIQLGGYLADTNGISPPTDPMMVLGEIQNSEFNYWNVMKRNLF